MNKTVLIGGGSFQGKSLIALHIGFKLKIPLIICTDMIRNILHVLHPTSPYFFTSTYLMLPKDLERQMNEISDVLRELLSIYDKRGENVIIEGMHLSPAFISYVSERPNTLIFCLNNTLPLEKRLEYKSLTRHRLEHRNSETGNVTYKHLTKDSLKSTPYMQHAHRIEEIHLQIVKWFSQRNLAVIEFDNINVARSKVDRLIDKWLEKCNTTFECKDSLSS